MADAPRGRQQPDAQDGRQERTGHAAASAAFLAPAAFVGVAVALAVGSYVPLSFDPPEAAADEAQVTTVPDLTMLDTSELEGEQVEPLAAAADVGDLGIDISSLPDGTYTGSGTGFSGTTTVQVTISGGRITAIRILSAVDQANYLNSASAVIDRVISAQSTSVDTVSGATYSSRGILQAIRNALRSAAGLQTEALSQAQGSTQQAANVQVSVPDIDVSSLVDGVYVGTGRGFEDGATVMRVTVAGGRIVSVENVSNEDTAAYWSRASVLMRRIVDAQSVQVDTVTGATYSSRGILEGVSAALAQAKGTSPTPAADKDALAAQIAEAEALRHADYTDDSWAAFQQALDAAVETNAATGATQSEVDAALSALREAQEALVPAAPDPTPEPGDDTPHYADGTYVGHALCDAGEDGDFFPYYVAVRVTVTDGVPQPLQALDPADAAAEVYGTSEGSEGDPALAPFDAGNNTYLGYAVMGRTRRGRSYTGLVEQLNAYVALHGTAPTTGSVDVVTGATYSSRAIVAAYQDALAQAEEAWRQAQGSADPDEPGEPSEGGDTGGRGDSGNAGDSDTTGDQTAADGTGQPGDASGEAGQDASDGQGAGHDDQAAGTTPDATDGEDTAGDAAVSASAEDVAGGASAQEDVPAAGGPSDE